MGSHDNSQVLAKANYRIGVPRSLLLLVKSFFRVLMFSICTLSKGMAKGPSKILRTSGGEGMC